MSVTGTISEAKLPAVGNGERLGRFRPGERKRASYRYSRFVTAMKVLLPTSALALITLVAIWPLLDRQEPAPAVPVADVPERAAGAEAQILNPRFVGVDNDGRPFSVVGTIAYQSISNTAALEIANPVAELAMDEVLSASASADWAEYDREGASVSLSGAVSLTRSDGFVFSTEELAIDLERERAWSDMPVHATGPGVDLDAAGVIVRRGGESVLFFGPTRLRVEPESDITDSVSGQLPNAATPPTEP